MTALTRAVNSCRSRNKHHTQHVIICLYMFYVGPMWAEPGVGSVVVRVALRAPGGRGGRVCAYVQNSHGRFRFRAWGPAPPRKAPWSRAGPQQVGGMLGRGQGPKQHPPPQRGQGAGHERARVRTHPSHITLSPFHPFVARSPYHHIASSRLQHVFSTSYDISYYVPFWTKRFQQALSVRTVSNASSLLP